MTDLLRLFTRTHKVLRARTDQAMSRYGVRAGQNLMLEALWENDGRTPGELAERLGVATPTVVKSASRMEAAGLLTRQRDPKDGRLVRLYLTDQSRAVRHDIEREVHDLAERATATLTAEERRNLATALSKILAALEK
ncbi:MarR family transcriptional regulator [Actinocrispum sp. NPDC049592]|uniref:MarR family winged helix-turn-helix transcriptional regulator n=1 Tax=Actinocrispum sp. NPDC049592 TaxID=3154835 RepID=UPI0034297A90